MTAPTIGFQKNRDSNEHPLHEERKKSGFYKPRLDYCLFCIAGIGLAGREEVGPGLYIHDPLEWQTCHAKWHGLPLAARKRRLALLHAPRKRSENFASLYKELIKSIRHPVGPAKKE